VHEDLLQRDFTSSEPNRVLIADMTYARSLEVAELLETVLGRSVELVTLESLSPILAPKILADAQDVIRAA
jgi:predicted nucleotidyltransferase